MKTKSLPMLLLACLITCTLNARAVAESWENSFALEQQGDKGEGTWVKGTYLWGYMNDDTALNQGFYTIDHETNDTTLFPNPVLKGVEDITWEVKRNYETYYAKLDMNSDGKRLIRARKNVTLESSVISGGIDWITVDIGEANGAVLRITLVSAADNKITLYQDFEPVGEGIEQVKLETEGTPFEEIDDFIIKAGFAGDSYFNLFNISWMSKNNGMSVNRPDKNRNIASIKVIDNKVSISGMEQENRICIYNILGQPVYEQVVNGPELSIPSSLLPSGALIIKVTGTTGETTKKIIL